VIKGWRAVISGQRVEIKGKREISKERTQTEASVLRFSMICNLLSVNFNLRIRTWKEWRARSSVTSMRVAPASMALAMSSSTA
jgi:hypothetical protein